MEAAIFDTHGIIVSYVLGALPKGVFMRLTKWSLIDATGGLKSATDE